MPKGAIATIDVRRPLRPGSGSLCWFVPPAIVPASAERLTGSSAAGSVTRNVEP